MSQALLYKEGKLSAEASFEHDGDKDGAKVVEFKAVLSIDVIEGVKEVIKKQDKAMLNALLPMITEAIKALPEVSK